MGVTSFVVTLFPPANNVASLTLECIIAALWVLLSVAVALQRPLIVGLYNPFAVTHRKFPHLYQLLLWLARLSIWLYVVWFLSGSFLTPLLSTERKILLSIALSRIIRWTWHRPHSASLEILIAMIVKRAWSIGLETPLLIWVVSFCLDRFWGLTGKLFYMFVALGTTLFQPEQRVQKMGLFVFLAVITFPVSLLSVVCATILETPIVPILGLPIFWFGFPRPRRQHLHSGIGGTNAPEGTLYKQLLPHLMSSLHNFFRSGVVGEPQLPAYFLLRMESRIVWVELIERGLNYAVVVIKGLELQETSCHHLEAGRIDDIFANTFHSDERNNSCFSPYLFHTLTPLGTIATKTYTKSRITLTGIIDYPHHLGVMSQLFFKCLLWVFSHHTIEETWTSNLHYSVVIEAREKFPVEWHSFLQEQEGKKATFISNDPLATLATACYAVVEVLGCDVSFH